MDAHTVIKTKITLKLMYGSAHKASQSAKEVKHYAVSYITTECVEVTARHDDLKQTFFVLSNQ